MNDNDKEHDDKEEVQLELTPPSSDDWDSDDKLFGDFDEDDNFEESDRDTDYASIYTEVEEEEFEEPEEEQMVFDVADIEPESEPEEESWEVPARGVDQDSPGLVFDASRDTEPESGPQDNGDDIWEEEEFLDDGEEDNVVTLPLGLIIVGIVALILVGAGGYGIMEQRAAAEEEIRQLQARLATATQPKEASQARTPSQELMQENQQLQQQIEQLSSENRSLEAIVAGLEKQLQAQQEALNKAPAPAPKPAPKPKAKPAPVATPKPAAAAASTSSTGGNWFVNFGSYSQQATAESWAARLRPNYGTVVVATGEKNGQTFYRVRVINLSNKDSANTTARSLEQKYSLSKLWVGQAG